MRAQLKAEGRPSDFEFTTDAIKAVAGADIVYTDVWASMGHEDEALARAARMRPYCVTARLFAAAKPDALFTHCLPAHPGEEVEQAVLNSPRSIIFDEAENGLHAQKALMSVLSASVPRRGDGQGGELGETTARAPPWPPRIRVRARSGRPRRPRRPS